MSTDKQSIQKFIDDQVDKCLETILDRYALSSNFAQFAKLVIKGCCLKTANFVLKGEVEDLRRETSGLESYKKMPDWMDY